MRKGYSSSLPTFLSFGEYESRWISKLLYFAFVDVVKPLSLGNMPEQCYDLHIWVANYIYSSGNKSYETHGIFPSTLVLKNILDTIS